LSLICLADNSWDEGSEPLPEILVDLNSKHLSRVHLSVEKLYNPPEFRRNLAGDKDHPYATCLQVGLDLCPKIIHG